jgi:hypothetical protein
MDAAIAALIGVAAIAGVLWLAAALAERERGNRPHR